MNKPFSALKAGVLIYAPWIAVGVLIIAANAAIWLTIVGVLFLLSGLYALFFFRDPHRPITAAPNEIVAPADGKIVAIEDLDDSPWFDGPCRRVSIFLSLFNVHVNRAPFGGTVERIDYRPGQFLNAMLKETTDCNEANAVWMRTDRGQMVVRQISGLIARRIVCPVGVGASLAKGEKFGMIRFGSRTELYLPPGTQVLVKLGDAILAGSSVVAVFDAE